MFVTDELRKRVDRMLAANLGLVAVPRLADGEADAGAPTNRDQPYEVAMPGWQKAAIQRLMHASGADAGFDRTIGRMTHGEFSASEIKSLEDRALDKLSWGDAMKLGGVEEGPPVVFTSGQKAIVDGLVGRLGDDPLARRTRDAYGRALRDRQVRVGGR